MASTLLSQIERVRTGATPVEFVYQSHQRWPLQAQDLRGAATATATSDVSDVSVSISCLSSSRNKHRPACRISVLDSSFNPPTLAHLALAKSKPPLALPGIDSISAAAGYDARLLLLSVRNADKSLKPGDATHSQRVEMMIELAHELEGQSGGSVQSNVAVALINEPTFVRKSTVLSQAIGERLASKPSPALQLTFLLGFDTLERLFDPRYYGSPDSMLQSIRSFLSDPPSGEGSRVVCAHRVTSDWLSSQASGVNSTDLGEEDRSRRESATMRTAGEFIQTGAVSFIDLTDAERRMSSSEVRKRVVEGCAWEAMVPHRVADYIKREKLFSALFQQ